MTSIEQIETLRRKRAAFDMRQTGMSYRLIAEHFGVHTMTAHNWIREVTQMVLPVDTVEELRIMDVDKIDADEYRTNQMLEWLMQDAQRRVDAGEVVNTGQLATDINKHQQHLQALRKERAKLLGLEKPIKILHEHELTQPYDKQMEDLVAQLAGGSGLLSNPDEVLDVD